MTQAKKFNTSSTPRPGNENQSQALEEARAKNSTLARAKQKFKSQRRSIRVDHMEPHELQTRVFRSKDGLESLAADLVEKGQLQAVGVVQIGTALDGLPKYGILWGTRRWASVVQNVGKEEYLECEVLEVSDNREILDLMTSENAEREDLTTYEVCRAIALYKENTNLTHEEIGQRMKLTKSQVENRWYAWRDSAPELHGGDNFLRKMLERGEDTVSHVGLIVKFPSRKLQKEMAEKVIRDGLSVEAVRAALDLALPKAPPRVAEDIRPANPSAPARKAIPAPATPATPEQHVPQPANNGITISRTPAPARDSQETQEQLADLFAGEFEDDETQQRTAQLASDYLKEMRGQMTGLKNSLDDVLQNKYTTAESLAALMVAIEGLREDLRQAGIKITDRRTELSK